MLSTRRSLDLGVWGKRSSGHSRLRWPWKTMSAASLPMFPNQTSSNLHRLFLWKILSYYYVLREWGQRSGSLQASITLKNTFLSPNSKTFLPNYQIFTDFSQNTSQVTYKTYGTYWYILELPNPYLINLDHFQPKFARTFHADIAWLWAIYEGKSPVTLLAWPTYISQP